MTCTNEHLVCSVEDNQNICRLEVCVVPFLAVGAHPKRKVELVEEKCALLAVARGGSVLSEGLAKERTAVVTKIADS
jgi:hypothetical protein